ncbi:MAG: tRNA 2-thiouridine(34) synthase MnmA [Deltaproteobacteria bacterium]|nr:tRNA 2-thiouridine(34) synthase MnmA [Deltaproteobacteria bacterium]
MSGGVDSSVVALLLRDAGHEVVGLSMKLYDAGVARSASEIADEACDATKAKGCCTPEDMNDARRVAAEIGIPHYVLDYSDAFEAAVIRPFVAEYARGRTPSPCVLCNDRLKFRALLMRARALGCAAIATGHYARVDAAGGRFRLLRARDRAKDQAYYLFGLGQNELRETLFPLGEMEKGEVRERARAAGLPVSDKPDSQEACFLEGQSIAAFLSRHGVSSVRGEIVDERGETRGRHEGAARFTVGQRHGLAVADRHPLYVLSVDVGSNRVVVGPRESLAARGLVADGARWVSGVAPAVNAEVLAQVRSRHTPVAARVESTGESMTVRFESPVIAVAPGQAVVVSRGDEILGGGWIRDGFADSSGDVAGPLERRRGANP